ncbi:hypothetical protein XELAEV_18024149mg [Xenopus laevis]|uniref:Uncharacterized protein n=1 Tax=Xenopus laevis TaxID=8355 RepID=A0A974D5Q1_XENLA|nr:hypothetical protein XELAEV_18024149mg [Xenopus laevis]
MSHWRHWLTGSFLFGFTVLLKMLHMHFLFSKISGKGLVLCIQQSSKPGGAEPYPNATVIRPPHQRT